MANIAAMHRTTSSSSPGLPALTAQALCAVVLAGCASTHIQPSPTVQDAGGSVLLISVDALSPTALDAGWAPHISQLSRDGVRAAWVTPSYPALTFPNHYTLVTGLRPDRHGVTHNRIEDPVLGTFRTADNAAIADARWWNGAEPLWVTAERAGMPTASFFWPGTTAAIRGIRPRHSRTYDEAISIEERVDTVLEWLSEPPGVRPRLTTLYFEHVDDAAHDHGPRSDEAREATRKVDSEIGRLVETLRRRGVLGELHVVVVSDHGMAEVPPNQVVTIESMVDPSDARGVTDGQSIGFEPQPGRTARAEARLLGPHRGYDCWRKADMPARWHHGTHSRVPPIVCQMHEGFDALSAERKAKREAGATRGSHGYDPALPSMRAVFVARGPRVIPGATVGGIDNVDVYPFLARLLGLTPLAHDGDATRLDAAMR